MKDFYIIMCLLILLLVGFTVYSSSKDVLIYETNGIVSYVEKKEVNTGKGVNYIFWTKIKIDSNNSHTTSLFTELKLNSKVNIKCYQDLFSRKRCSFNPVK